MTAYQKYWNTTITQLLNAIDASEGLRTNIIGVLQNSMLTGVFPNQVINALRIALSIKEGHKNVGFVAPMQSGKSGTAYVLCNYVLPEIGFIKEKESILFVTSMRDTDLYEQNRKNLEADFFDFASQEHKPSYIQVIKMNEFFKHPNPHKVVNDFDVRLIVRDEDQYGAGEESSFKMAFFDELRRRMPDIKLLAVSATPYDILEAHFSEEHYDVDIVEGERPPQYYGITEMLEEGVVEDYPKNFRPLQSQMVDGEEVFTVHPKVHEYVDHLLAFEDGLGIIRTSNTTRALELRDQLRKMYKRSITCVAIGSDAGCNYKIQEGLEEVKKMITKQGKRVVLIVVQALTAGKDLKLLKEKVRFGIETRDKQLANGAQGITGRLCGYHNNRNFKLMASVHLLEHYAEFEQDWEIFAEDEWRNGLYNGKVKGLSTHTKFQQEQKQGMFTPIVKMEQYTYQDLLTEKVKEALYFLDEEAYDRLLAMFKPEFYERNTKGERFKTEGVTVRIASSYNSKSNRVYNNWECTMNADFGNIFFKKQQYEYGLLISNYPAHDDRNPKGFCGVKVLQSGSPVYKSQKTSVVSPSMYRKEQEEDEADFYVA
ncbi:DEAD/DEAH box helicase [Robertkochia sediminum]|uniref:hypothetical protein n=1 Tax=Robertkochia sediminum TaxID=2785326 RepID=UPI00193322C5|nr:hypothetical protein [Robertkochia sediminum]MBL7471378.1 hypothetical protein [Robertkochia sediminum]